MVDLHELQDKVSDAWSDKDEALSLQGSIDELESERDAHIEEVQKVYDEVTDILDEADGDEDWYQDVQDMQDDLQRMLDTLGVIV